MMHHLLMDTSADVSYFPEWADALIYDSESVCCVIEETFVIVK